MTANKELTPCPFCGGKAIDKGGYGGITYIKCEQCGAIVSFDGKESYLQAIEAWNRRANNDKQ